MRWPVLTLVGIFGAALVGAAHALAVPVGKRIDAYLGCGEELGPLHADYSWEHRTPPTTEIFMDGYGPDGFSR